MIHFVIATYTEAKALITFFKLKKKSGKLQFDIFLSSNKKISLTISGIGKIQAVASVIYTKSIGAYVAFSLPEGFSKFTKRYVSKGSRFCRAVIMSACIFLYAI